MKYNVLRTAALLSICISANAFAEESYLCTLGQEERIISIMYEDLPNKVSCEVRYHKGDGVSALWSATTELGFCEEKAESFVQKQINWGWECSKVETTKTN